MLRVYAGLDEHIRDAVWEIESVRNLDECETGIGGHVLQISCLARGTSFDSDLSFLDDCGLGTSYSNAVHPIVRATRALRAQQRQLPPLGHIGLMLTIDLASNPIRVRPL